MSNGNSERTGRAQRFWDTSADWDVRRAIWDSEELGAESTRERAFDDSGVGDARRLAAFVHPAARVLDLGCGIGRVMRPLAPLVAEIVGIDISEKMIAEGRRYLEGVPNARLVHTGGAELPGIARGSIDFLFSLICLIHVDKRTAFRYLREVERVLAPGGLALLQFENLQSDEGLAEFRRVVDLEEEYPLEFYTPEEVRRLAGAVGLQVLSLREERQFLFATLMREDPAQWIRTVREGIALELLGAQGIFAGQGTEGRLAARVTSRLARPFALHLNAEVRPRHGPGRVYGLEGPVLLRPGVDHRVEIVHDASGAGWACIDGEPLPLGGCLRGLALPRGELQVVASLTPPGFGNDAETARLFPALYPDRPVTFRTPG